MRAMTNVTAFTSARDAAGRPDEASDKSWRIYLAGNMQMVGPAGENALPRPRKTRGLLAYLCLTPGKRASRSRLAALLWDKTDDLARRSLRQALYDLDRLSGARANGLIRLDQDYVSLNGDICWIDVIAEPDRHLERLLDDLDGLSEAFDRWLCEERIRFEDRARNVLYAEVTRLESECAPPERRAAAARKLVSFDPTHEGGVRALMKALADLGDHVQALREYQRCRTELRKTHDVSPARETIALHEAIRLVSSRNVPKVERVPNAELIALNVAGPASERPDAPSIAVLPFANLSGEPQHDYTAAGLAEDLIAVLSRLAGFFVTSRMTTRSFREQADRSPQDIGDMLDVRYLFSGGLRSDGNRLRVNAELTDAVCGHVLWTGGIDERFSNLIDVPLRLAEEIVRQAAPYLRQAELSRVRSKRPEQLNAYDYFLQAQDDMHNFSPIVFGRAERMFDAALARAPAYAGALAWRAYWHVLRIGQGWSPDAGRDAKLAGEFAARALDCDPLEPMAHAVQGHIAAYLHKEFDLAFERFETALRLNPNAAPVWLWRAATRAWDGDGRAAVEDVKRGTALSPYDPLMYFSHIVAGMAYLTDAQYERAVDCAYLSLRENTRYTAAHRLLVMALMLAGRPEEARAAADRLLVLEPGVTVEKFKARYPGARRLRTDLYCEALAQAGVPRR
jgi:TolB-like protein